MHMCIVCLPPHVRDSTKVEVYEHGMSLSIVALRGSVPNDWVM